MPIRILKIILTGFVAIFCLMYALQNLMNLEAAYGFVAAMAGMENHLVYPKHFGLAVHAPIIIWLMLGIIILLEFVAGTMAAKGVVDLWRARKTSADTFNSAKQFALMGCGVAVIIWFGIFSAIGGAYFQMWQTELGAGALAGAFQYTVLNGIVYIIINTTDS